MPIVLLSHPACYEHDSGRSHPERPPRLDAAIDGVGQAGVPVRRMEAPPASLDDLALVHDEAYVEVIREFCAAGGGSLDADTHAVAASWEAALRAAGAGLAAVSELEQGRAEAAFLAIRPPGHHALSNRAMGFCLFNNIAVTAASLANAGSRVAIVDWDVHHGNGTQEMFYTDSRVLYVSIHEAPFYPFTGWTEERGEGDGAGSVVNVGLPWGTAGDVFRDAVDQVVVPQLTAFRPDWVLISAGFDAHLADPLAGLELVEHDYQYAAGRISLPGRTVMFLEGGYDLDAVRGSVSASLRGVADPSVEIPAPQRKSPRAARAALEAAIEQIAGGP